MGKKYYHKHYQVVLDDLLFSESLSPVMLSFYNDLTYYETLCKFIATAQDSSERNYYEKKLQKLEEKMDKIEKEMTQDELAFINGEYWFYLRLSNCYTCIVKLFLPSQAI
jgi:cob(I)alamin adenosyltransferase